MIFRQLSIENFGLYGGAYTFDLAPFRSDTEDRPIVVFRGKNGVGKSTIMEAFRLCLHGPLALGKRLARDEYSQHLTSRMHRPAPGKEQVCETRLEVVLDYVRLGRKVSFCISRSWKRSGSRVVETVEVTEDGKDLQDLRPEHREGFIRELVPPRATDLFFFDSEKLYTMADEVSASALLAETSKGLLGLDLVERLQGDLDTYLSRQTAQTNAANVQNILQALHTRTECLRAERDTVQADQEANRQDIEAKQRAIAAHEQRIKGESTSFADQRDELKAQYQRLTAEIDGQRRLVQEMVSGLMPFAISPEMCRKVEQRLRSEEEFEQWNATQGLIVAQQALLARALSEPGFWDEVGVDMPLSGREKLLAKLSGTLHQASAKPSIGPDDVILHVSGQERHTMLSHLEQATTSVPRAFSESVSELGNVERDLQRIEEALKKIPADEVLRPLTEQLNVLNQELGFLQHRDDAYRERLRQLDYEVEQVASQLREARQELARREKSNESVQMAARTQAALDEYATELVRAKLRILEQALVGRFNLLCRKEMFVEQARIDPATFNISLVQNGRPVERAQLSAGEKQLLATATMWALREVSGLPFPVIVDTPVGRLDSEHRHIMATDYFPRASHQVILLATDVELSGEMLDLLSSAISHQYELSYEPGRGATAVAARHFVDKAPTGQEALPL